MKRTLILLILSFLVQNSFGQACGIYRIKYLGSIKSISLKIEKVKLPTIKYLHGLETENSERGFVEIKPIKNDIDIELVSHITSCLYDKSDNLLKFYKRKRENIPVVITVIENGKNKEIRVKLTWNNIEIKKLEDENFGNIFEMNLNEINIE